MNFLCVKIDTRFLVILLCCPTRRLCSPPTLHGYYCLGIGQDPEAQHEEARITQTPLISDRLLHAFIISVHWARESVITTHSDRTGQGEVKADDEVRERGGVWVQPLKDFPEDYTSQGADRAIIDINIVSR